jgi:hypothetical protein
MFRYLCVEHTVRYNNPYSIIRHKSLQQAEPFRNFSIRRLDCRMRGIFYFHETGQTHRVTYMEYRYRIPLLTTFLPTSIEFCTKLTTIFFVSLIGSYVVWTFRQIPTFRRNILPPYSGLNTKALCSSETLVST